MKKLDFVVVQGHQVASGIASNSPYSDGTIKLQKPIFRQLGLDLTGYYNGTINAFFESVKSIDLNKCDYKFNKVKWHEIFPAESFQFIQCNVVHRGIFYKAFIYQPVKETKIGHMQPENVLEIIAEPIEGLAYGDQLTLAVSPEYLDICSY